MIIAKITTALEKWGTVLPPESIRTSASELEAATEATFSNTVKISAILVPESTQDVARILKIASETRCNVYPYSRGKNWGLGSRLPAADDCVLIDLSAMNLIHDYDPVMGTITVQPGVCFSQVAAYLSDKKSKFYASVTGGSPYGSLIGNALDRGGGDGPMGDRAANMAALEVVLATGEIVRTGFARFGQASTAKLVKQGVGYSLQELLTQSNLGVVTKATFWLQRIPAERAYLLSKLNGVRELAVFLNEIRELLQEDVIYPQSVYIWNSFKTLARSRANHIKVKIRPDHLNSQSDRHWTSTIMMHAAESQMLDSSIQVATKRLMSTSQTWSELRKHDVSASDWARLTPGNPIGLNVISAYWRKRGQMPDVEDLDPDRDRCGLLWICPSLPLEGDVISTVMAKVEGIILNHDFEPNIGFNPISARAIEAYIGIMYDLDVPGEDGRAIKCHDVVVDWLISQGHFLFRLGTQSMGKLPSEVDGSIALFRRIKQAFDPEQIISPGRYLAHDLQS